MSNKRIAVLGGGAAGLATAYKLVNNSHDLEVSIIEKEPELGGLARSVSVSNIPVDLGPHRIHTQLPEIHRFLNEFLGSDMFIVPRKSQMYFKGGYFDYPIRFFNALSHLGVVASFRYGFSAIFGSLMGSTPGKDDSFDKIMQKAFGKAAYEDLIRPYSEKFWKITPDQIDAEVAKVRVSAGGIKKLVRQVLGMEKEVDPSALKEFHYLAGGFHDLVRKFEKFFTDKPVEIHTSAKVTSLCLLNDGKLRLEYEQVDGKREREDFDFCFSTIPVDDLVKMLTQEALNDEASKVANKLKFVSMILVVVEADKPQISDNTWLYFPEKELIFNRGYEGKNFVPQLKTDSSVICLEVTCYKGDELWQTSDQEIGGRVAKQFCSTGMLKEGEVKNIKVLRLTHAYPLLTKGSQQRLQVLWDYLSNIPSLITLGRQGLFQHNNTDHSMYMGFSAADLFGRSSSAAREWYQSEIENFRNFRIID